MKLKKRSDIVAGVHGACPNLPNKVVEHLVRKIFEKLSESIANNERIEIRGFGSFTSKKRVAGMIRNPREGISTIDDKDRYVVRFKAGKALRDRVDC